MKKKFWLAFFAVLTSLCMVLSFAACKEAKPDDTGNDPSIIDPSDGEQGNTPAPHAHSFGEWKLIKKSTCEEAGVRERECICGEKETEALPLAGHDFENMICKGCGIQASLGLQYSLINEDKEYEVSGIGSCSDTDLIIPNNYQGKPVTSIGNKAFTERKKLTTVIFPDSIVKIGESAFFFCEGLTAITIPGSVTTIGEMAFAGCSGLAGELKIPAGVTSIGQYAFVLYGSDALDWDNIDGLDTIIVAEDNPVYRSENNCLIEKATNTLLLGCKNSVIPQNITKIGEGAFLSCRWMTKLEIPNGVMEIGELAFADCRGLTSVSIPKSVKKIEEQAFAYCNGLKEVHISDVAVWCGIKFEGGDANPLGYAHHLYKDGEEIKRLEIPEDVTSIGEKAFEDCSGLTEIIIPDSVTSIGDSAFGGCSGLEHIGVAKGNQTYHSEQDCLIETRSKTLVLGCKNSVIPNGVTSIGGSAFEGCSGLTEITIPDSVTSIGDWAFEDCRGLTSVTIGSGVTSIGSYAFSWCSVLTEIQYGGTINAWKTIAKDYDWNYGTGNYTVYCTGGTITKDGKETY